ncbi:MAG: ABC transporter ATP-binding protein [Actinomycetota bacterium]|nr:ABC transporter ATP-binding protein [Actinomycetota bacterium]
MAEPAADPIALRRLLEINDLRVEYVAGRMRRTLVSGVDLHVDRGETIAIVGESGSGKTLTARAIIRLLPTGVEATAGEISLDGQDVLRMSDRAAARLRGNRISMIFQDPFTMLNPVLRCAGHVEEVLRNRANPVGSAEARSEAIRRLAEVGIDDPGAADRYPFQLSGGMRQRVGLAAALAGDPELLIADEPSTALDVTTQAEILDLLKSVQQARGMGLILITHDLRVAFSVAERVYVLYAGALVEVSNAKALEREPLHPYSLGLLLSEPATEFRQVQLLAIDGSVPAPDEVAQQCSFASRCRWCEELCVAERPPLREVEPERFSACRRLEEIREEMTSVRREVRAPALQEAAAAEVAPFLAVRNLQKVFAGQRGGVVRALDGVSITVGANESVGIVGESGSGKTTLGRCLVGLENPTSGLIEIDGIDASNYSKLTRADRARLRRIVQIVFQDPYSSLDRTETVGAALREVLVVNKFPAEQVKTRIDELLQRVGLPLGYAKRRPAALSGGERQRVVIARTLAIGPRLIVCDEPVSALDVSVQAQILSLFRELREGFGLSYLFITHDLAVVRQVVDRVYVVYQGKVVEEGPVDRVLDQPEHPYTKRLIASIPRAAA